MTLVMSLWDDTTAKMAWLDGVYPPGATSPGSKRGPCPVTDAMELRKTVPNSYVTYSNIKVTSLSTSPVPQPKPLGERWLCDCTKV